MKKTTLMIEEGLYHQIRQAAASENRTVSSGVTEALAAYMAERTPPANARRPMPVAKGATWFLPEHIDPTSNAQNFNYLDQVDKQPNAHFSDNLASGSRPPCRRPKGPRKANPNEKTGQ